MERKYKHTRNLWVNEMQLEHVQTCIKNKLENYDNVTHIPWPLIMNILWNK